MKDGIVKWFNANKGYGFIEADGSDYFVHYSSINMQGYKVLTEGQNVTFQPTVKDKGKTAENVNLVSEH